MRRGWRDVLRPCVVLTTAFVLSPAPLATAQAPSAAKTRPKPTQPGTMTEGNIDKAGGGFRRVLEAAKKLDAAKASYAADQETLSQLLAAQQALTSAQIQYMAATTEVRGNAALRDYLTLRGEVSARERGLAEIIHLINEVPDHKKQQVRDEIKRQSEALELARKELSRAELTWKTADRAEQFRYLNRRATTAR